MQQPNYFLFWSLPAAYCLFQFDRNHYAGSIQRKNSRSRSTLKTYSCPQVFKS